jgi:predicted MPP superfamily phosphohydrolase
MEGQFMWKQLIKIGIVVVFCSLTFPSIMKQVVMQGQASDYASAEVEHTMHEQEDGEKKDKRVTFSVISDIQTRDNDDYDLEKLDRAMDMVNKYAPKQDAIAVVGDLTNNGREKQYNRFMNAYLAKKQPDAVSLLSMGNHDYWNNLTEGTSHKRFKEKTGMKHIFYHHVINGYHFIVLSPESGPTHGLYSIPQIKWLKRQLQIAEKDDPKQPIFVFVHHHIKGTVYGSDEWGTSTNHNFLYETLKGYPQVVTFSGHSHYPLNNPKSIHQRDFTSIGLSSVNYIEVEEGKVQGNYPSGYMDISQGVVVEAIGNKVKIKRLDFIAGKLIGRQWIIREPSNKATFRYTDDRDKIKPVFPKQAVMMVQEEKRKGDSLSVIFDQALDNECVHAYRIKAIETGSNKVVYEQQMFSEFYKTPVPKRLTANIEDLNEGTTYRIEITAIDSFDNESGDMLVTEGTTKK